MVLKENKMKKPWKYYFPRLFGTHERIRTSDLSLRRYVCRIACDVLTYTAVHFDHATAIIHILCCAIQSTLRAYYNQSNR